MTPQLPLAPINNPLAKASVTLFIRLLFIFSTSLTPDVIDKFIFVPVSPSGTGNTFNASIFSELFDKWCAPESTIFVNACPSNVCSVTIFPPLSVQTLLTYPDTLNVNIHGVVCSVTIFPPLSVQTLLTYPDTLNVNIHGVNG